MYDAITQLKNPNEIVSSKLETCFFTEDSIELSGRDTSNRGPMWVSKYETKIANLLSLLIVDYPPWVIHFFELISSR